MSLSELWSQLTPARLTAGAILGEGAALGDERGLLLVVDAAGEIVSEQPLPAPIHDVAARDDLVAVACGEGRVFAVENGKVIVQHESELPVRTVLVGPHADYVVALAPNGRGEFVNRYGRVMSTFAVPEGVETAALVPRTGNIVTTAREGSVQALAPWGKPLWRIETMCAPGRVRTDERGDLIIVPVMTYGVDSLSIAGRSLGAYDVGEPVKVSACSGDGEIMLFATSKDRLVLIRKDASVVFAEVFPAPVTDIELSSNGERALVTTSSGYAHLLALAGRGDQPFLELTDPQPAPKSQYVLKQRVFSPFSMILRTRLDFAPDSEFVALGGDRRKVQVFDLEGDPVASRRYGGTLLDLRVNRNREVRVFATQSVFRFQPEIDGSVPEWVAEGDLSRVEVTEDGGAVALTEDGFAVGFPPHEGRGQRLFALRDPIVKDFGATVEAVAVVNGRGQVGIYSRDGEERALAGPWPARPKLLAWSNDGFLVGIKKLVILIGIDGTTLWHQHLPSPAATATAVPGAFLVLDEAGTAHIATPSGVLRKAFSADGQEIVPFPDAGEGPGFLILSGNLVTAVTPAGRPRWRFRTPDPVTWARPSPDGRFAGAFAGTDLYVFRLVADAEVRAEAADPHAYLEFGDG